MAATSVLLSVKDKTAAVSVFTTPTVTPHTSGLQVLTVCAIGSVNAESQPAVTVASGLTGQGAITAIPNAGVGGAATTCGIWSFFIKSTTGSVVAGTYQIAFAGASTPTAFSVDVIEYQAGDWDSTLGTPIINGCASTVVTGSPTATFPGAPATSSRCGAFMGSRNKIGTLGVGTSPWAILTGTDLHEAATPSATSIIEERTGSASTLVDGSAWGTTGNAIIGWEVPAAQALAAFVQWISRDRILLPRVPRRTRGAAVPPAAPETLVPAVTRPRRVTAQRTVRRRAVPAPVPAAAVAAAPAYIPAPARRRIVAPQLRRRRAPAPNAIPPVPSVLPRAIQQRRKTLPRLPRHQGAPVLPALVVAAQPAFIQQSGRRRTGWYLPLDRRRVADALPVVAATPPPAFVPSSPRHRAVIIPIGHRRTVPVIPAATLVAPPAFIPAATRRRIPSAPLTRRARAVQAIITAAATLTPAILRRRVTPPLRAARGRIGQPVPAAVVLSAPAFIPVSTRRVRRLVVPKRPRGYQSIPDSTAPVVATPGLSSIALGVGTSSGVVPGASTTAVLTAGSSQSSALAVGAGTSSQIGG